MFTTGPRRVVVSSANVARADVRVASQDVRRVHGWRTLLGNDGSSCLVDVELRFVLDVSGRPIRVAQNGELFVVGLHGRQQALIADERITGAGALAPNVEVTTQVIAGWRTAPTSAGTHVLISAQPDVVIGEEGEPICVAPSGDLYVATGDERFAVDGSAFGNARVEFNVDVDIDLDVSVLAGYRVVDAGSAAKVMVNGQGELLVDDAGYFVHVDEAGEPFTMQGGLRVALNVQLPSVVAMLAGAQVAADMGAEGYAAATPGVTPSPFIAAPAAPATAAPATAAPAHAVPTPQPLASSAQVDARINAEVNVQIETQVDVQVAVAIPTAGQPGSDAQHVGGPTGVSAVAGGRANFNMLVQGEVRVDGFRLGLGDLGPIAPLTAHARTDALQTSPAIRVHAGLEHAQLPRAGGETNLVVEVEGGPAPSQSQTKVRLHLVIDRSSSMQSSWGDVLAAAELLVGELGADDSIQVVAYGTNVQEVLPLQRAGNGRAAISALRRITVGGGTNIEVGLRAAYDAAGAQALVGNERSLVILLSDGVPNGGAYTADALAPMARQAREGACTTTVIGLGNQFDPVVLRAIADAGLGSYHVARGTSELADMLREELRAQQRIAVRDVQIQLQLAGGVQLLDGGQVDAAGNLIVQMPQLREGEQRRMEFRVNVPAGVQNVGRLNVGYRSGHVRSSASKNLSVAFGTEAQLASAGPAFVIADKDLGRALDLAANAVLNGQGAVASQALSAHVTRIEARADFGTHRALRARTQAAGRFAQALQTITPRASHSERRVFSLAMGELASTLLR